MSWSVAGRAAEPEIDAAGKEARQRSELLGDHIGRVVRQHDPAGADADRLRRRGKVGEDHRGGGAGDARHVVVLGHPDAAIAPALGVDGDISSVHERAARVDLLRDANQFEDGERDRGPVRHIVSRPPSGAGRARWL